MKYFLTISLLLITPSLFGYSAINRHYKVLNFCCHPKCHGPQAIYNYPEIINVD
ncbi:hypothetical protein Bealeia1_01158 [Candidatus Bealeia paramacronuclearis]|uniref:Uncharacterized protein n=1 Tax=Candidatus Bealeia paramacronuclearis TaxID=1921001 RepID=A0ABZ2C4I3_9PROT|nr:hypothetical protein [Candidatus Bealeia paramacronuclearis]